MINKWISRNIKVDKQMLIGARQGNIKEEYFFDKKVGQGGFGVVYSARNRLTKK